jgi:plasmid maintenance system antidote protein VapI
MLKNSTLQAWWAALEYCFNQSDFYTHDSLAAEAGVSRSLITEQINKKKSCSAKTQDKIAKAFGYDLVDFLQLGKGLLKEDDNSKRLDAHAKLRDNSSQRRGIFAVYLENHPDVEPEFHQEGPHYYLANIKRTKFEQGARYIAEIKETRKIITAIKVSGKKAYQDSTGVHLASERWGKPWIVGRVVFTGKEE